MTPTVRIPAKVLLFGEHSILRGSKALAMPLWEKGCEWQQGGNLAQQGGLPGLVQYLEAQLPSHYDLQQMREDLARGWYVASDIPVGYGLGSSAALCVAVFERYATDEGQAALRLQGPKVYFAQLESYFHGTSSGTDPLIIYERGSLLLHPDGTFETVELPTLPPGWQLFLLDTGQARETAPLVNYFTERYDTNAEFRQKADATWLPNTDKAIHALIAGKPTDLWEAFRCISSFQRFQLPPMIVPAITTAWQNPDDQHTHYQLKLCGAGGGGYYLGLSANWEATQSSLSAWPLETIKW